MAITKYYIFRLTKGSRQSESMLKLAKLNLDVRIRDSAHVHSRELHGLDDGDREGLRVEVVLQLVLELAQVARLTINLNRRD